MHKTVLDRQKIYDRWHKEVYQLDIKKKDKELKTFNELTVQYLGIDKTSKGKLLDVACGKGLFLKDVRSLNRNIQLYGSDISKVAINEAKKIVRDAEFSTADGENLPYKKNFFQYASCLGGLEYYQNPANGIKEISRVLKEGGICVMYVPNLMFMGYIWLAFRYGMMPTHGGVKKNNTEIYNYQDERFFTYRGWRDMIESGGFTILHTYSYNRIGGSRYAPRFITSVFNILFRKLVPFNLSYCYFFVCKK